jgi:hypothetical protein
MTIFFLGFAWLWFGQKSCHVGVTVVGHRNRVTVTSKSLGGFVAIWQDKGQHGSADNPNDNHNKICYTKIGDTMWWENGGTLERIPC